MTRLLGVDYGRVRVGLAISDPDRKFAFPLEIYTRREPGVDAAFFKMLVAREDVKGLVVGLPVRGSGLEDMMAFEARRFGVWLKEVTGLDVVMYDERYTTALAESLLWEAGLTHAKRKVRRDKVAAQILLQTYLEDGCPPETTPGPLDGEKRS